MTSRSVVLALLFILGSFSASAAVAPLKIQFKDPTASNVEFKAIGRPSALKIVGRGQGPVGDLALSDAGQITGALSFDLRGLDTGLKMRNDHMRDKYLEVAKHPEALLSITSLSIPKDKAAGDFTLTDVPFEGKLKLHGVEKPVQGKARVERKGDSATTEAAFKIKITDFGIEVPSFAGITVADDVDVKVLAAGKMSR